MYRFLGTRRWVALALLVLALVPAFVRLGLWQLDRYEQRSARNELTAGNLAAPAVPLDQVAPVGTAVPADLRWRHVQVRGRYDRARELLVRRRVQHGSVGYYVVTPLVTARGAAVLVNRGWVAYGRSARELPAVPAPPAGEVELTARLQPAETARGTGIRDLSGLPAGQVMLIDVPRLARSLPYPAYGGFVELVAQRPASRPAPEPVPAPEPSWGPQLVYAIQWWLFAVGAVAGFVLLARREARARSAYLASA